MNILGTLETQILLLFFLISSWFLAIVVCRKDKNAILLSIFATLIVLVLIIHDVFVLIKGIPENIEENGYTYQLKEFEPEQTIERYGRTYILVEE